LFSLFHRNSRKKRELVCLFTLPQSQSETSRLSFFEFSRTFHVRHLVESIYLALNDLRITNIVAVTLEAVSESFRNLRVNFRWRL
jgi:hypothetical protein